MKLKTCALALGLTATLILSACGSTESNNSGSAPTVSSAAGTTAAGTEVAATDAGTTTRLAVSVSFDAMAEFVKAVGQDYVEVSTIIPSGTEPHDFEPKAQDLVKLSQADVFVYNGLGMEAWAEESAEAAQNDQLVTVIASDGVETITNTDQEEIQEHGQYDPHVWLGLSSAEQEIKNIRDGLIKADPAHQTAYEANCEAYLTQLNQLLTTYQDKFSQVSHKTFVTGHAAFAYLCRDFDLEQNSVEDTFAEGEPTAAQLGELVEYCKANQVTTIFAEEMASPAVSQTLADEVGATVETIYTIESAEDELTYLERMESNLSKIYSSLSQ
ncbi:MAG: zinc ABC transporter substrate-binding protein [Oscillospiraceae bacterium]|nr:zinc ABC transporter substrate-binding protein [Oscillospiraceae bacterium]MDD4368907.1 zinc ABC transporter substrate-binding protein [Oscillospiraceae bacterium]